MINLDLVILIRDKSSSHKPMHFPCLTLAITCEPHNHIPSMIGMPQYNLLFIYPEAAPVIIDPLTK